MAGNDDEDEERSVITASTASTATPVDAKVAN
jgi:hypothetical protein